MTPLRKRELLKEVYLHRPVLFSILRNDGMYIFTCIYIYIYIWYIYMYRYKYTGERCCWKCPCKLLSCFVCFACCQDGAKVCIYINICIYVLVNYWVVLYASLVVKMGLRYITLPFTLYICIYKYVYIYVYKYVYIYTYLCIYVLVNYWVVLYASLVVKVGRRYIRTYMNVYWVNCITVWNTSYYTSFMIQVSRVNVSS
jgi:hypothetical protein